MKLVIHCGFHKTSTTSFQAICTHNRELLRALGVLYPKFGRQPQHSLLMWGVQSGGLKTLRSYLEGCMREARERCTTVLLSGEDFENCLVDVALAQEIEDVARHVGFETVEWLAVTRPSDAYVASIYSEMSKHGVVMSRDTLERGAKERGCFYVATDNFNYIFVFDLDRFQLRFERQVTGELIRFSFDEFVNPYPGHALLAHLMDTDALAKFTETAKVDLGKANSRLSPRRVQANYANTAAKIIKAN